jgi:hypothetical protein
LDFFAVASLTGPEAAVCALAFGAGLPAVLLFASVAGTAAVPSAIATATAAQALAQRGHTRRLSGMNGATSLWSAD